METTPTLLGADAPSGRAIPLDRARELLAGAAILDLERRRYRIRCHLGIHSGWWDLDEVYRLLALVPDVRERPGPDGVQLEVTDGMDVYRFDVAA
jgi:hypothetical protein